MNVNLGPREADLLMDALIALGGQWDGEDIGSVYGPKPGDQDRRDRLMDKLRPVARKGSR